jgi:hypothetical protein
LISIEKWVNEEILDNGRRDTFPLPSDIKPGMYIFRTDLLALHGNGYGGGLPKKGTGAGPQFYTHCFNLKVLGDGIATPDGVKFPGGYKREDPGIKFSLRNRAAFKDYVSISSLEKIAKLTNMLLRSSPGPLSTRASTIHQPGNHQSSQKRSADFSLQNSKPSMMLSKPRKTYTQKPQPIPLTG